MAKTPAPLPDLAFTSPDGKPMTLASLRGVLIPSDVTVSVVRNYGETAAEKSNELLEHMLIAVVSVSILIGLALGLREAGVVLTAIPVTLALSLHAPDDELRDTLVPINNRWKVSEVLDAAWEYARTTKRRVSIEYALIKDINDQAWRADLLAKRLRGKLVHVNLIPLNPTPGSQWTASRRKDEREVVRRLQAQGGQVTVRDTRGREIDGACGQLAASAR